MQIRRSILLTTFALTAFVVGAGAETNIAGNQGPSSSASPYVVPVAAGVRTVSVLTVGDSVNPKLDGVTPYRMVGLPDGLGAFDNGDGTFQLTMNHELSGGGVTRAHGSAAAFVSTWRIDKTTLAVKSGNDLIRTIETWNPATQAYVQGTTTFSRFCSADMPAVTAFYDAATGLGTTERIHMNGEENGSSGRAFANLATGPNTGVSWELPRIGKQSWENVVACPFAQTKTIVASDDDSSPGQVFVYVGTKLASGTDVQKAGLLNGTLYGVIANSALVEDRPNGIGLAKGVAGAFQLAALPDQSAAGANLETAANAALVTKFLRPEDGAWDPVHPTDYYFVTTDGALPAGRSRLWRLRFSDLANPQLGGAITMLLDGTEGGDMFDNICVDRLGHVLMQEDLGGNAKSGKIWQFDIASGGVKILAKHDPARFGDFDGVVTTPATSPFNNDEESSGIIDAADLLGPGWFLCDVQAHYGISGELAEGGQLLALYNPESVGAPAISAAASATPNPALVAQPVAFSVQASEPGDGAITYAWNFGDGGSAATKDASHVYGAAGVYTATVTATHTASGRTATSSVQVAVQRPFACFDVAVQLVFGPPSNKKGDHGWHYGWDDEWKDDRDQIAFSAEVPIPSGFAASGKVVSIDVGGVQRTFTLDSKGNGTSAEGDKCRLDFDKDGNAVPAQRAVFTAFVRAADLKSALADEKLTNRNASNEPVTVVAKLTFDGRLESQTLELIYDATLGKKGYAQ